MFPRQLLGLLLLLYLHLTEATTCQPGDCKGIGFGFLSVYGFHFCAINKTAVIVHQPFKTFHESGLIIAGGLSNGWEEPVSNIEEFSSEASCSIPPLPEPGNIVSASSTIISSKGRFGHSLSVINNTLVACGGYGYGLNTIGSSCIFWQKGQASWSHYHTLRCFNINLICCIKLTRLCDGVKSRTITQYNT